MEPSKPRKANWGLLTAICAVEVALLTYLLAANSTAPDSELPRWFVEAKQIAIICGIACGAVGLIAGLYRMGKGDPSQG